MPGVEAPISFAVGSRPVKTSTYLGMRVMRVASVSSVFIEM